MKPMLAACLILAVVQTSYAGGQESSSLGGRRVNTWAARSSTGLMLGGTWTATEDAKTGAVTGRWTLLDAKGRAAATGAWSAAKSTSGWTGNWRAAAAGRTGEYSGTWSARVDLKPNAKFADLFARAIQTAVGGTWRAGGQSGSWTIQAFD
jgi:hypothetical protein